MKKLYLLLFLILPLISCDRKQEPITPGITAYPMTVGSQWTYDRQLVVNKYESKTSKKIVSTDTYHFEVKVWVDKDTLLNGKPVVKFIATSEGLKHINFHFMDQEGLKTFAYSNAGPIVFAQSGIHLKSEALDKWLAEDPVIFEQSPVLDLKWPLQMGAQWTYRYATEPRPLKIEKQVTGEETLNLAGQHFNCYKIEWTYSNDSYYDHFKITDWVSDKGLIKRIQFFDDVTFQNENGDQLYFGQTEETLTLTGVDIKQ
jgi:hypothetical protein